MGDLNPKKRIVWVVDGCFEKRSDAVEVEVVINDRRVEAQEVAEDSYSA